MGLGYQNILVAIDGSKESEYAFKKAVAFAKENNSKLILAHIVDSNTYLYANANNEILQQTISEKGELFATELLDNYKEEAINSGVTQIECIIDFGSPKIKIPKDIAKKEHCELIVCGASGLNAVERFVMGSVSEHIARYAPCDVLIVRKEQEEI